MSIEQEMQGSELPHSVVGVGKDLLSATPVDPAHLSDLGYALRVLETVRDLVPFPERDAANGEIAAAINGLRYVIDRTRRGCKSDDYWIRQHAAARSAELAMRRQVDRIELELEHFALWLNECGLQHVAHEMASRVVIRTSPPGSVSGAQKPNEKTPAAPSPLEPVSDPTARLHPTRAEALIAVLEGECDGLAVNRETAEAILHYVDVNAAAALPVAPTAQPDARSMAEQAYTMSADWDARKSPVGSRDWVLFWQGFQAAMRASVDSAAAQGGE